MTVYLPTEDDRREIERLRRWIGKFGGDGVTNTPQGATVSPVARRRRGGDERPPDNSKFLARITASSSLATNRWYYTWAEVVPSGTTVASVSNGRSGTQAVNLAEMFHTSTYAWGVDTTGTDYPAGFVVQPVGGGGTSAAHRYDVVVEMTERMDPGTGEKVYTFSGQGSHDGTCDA